MNNDELKKKIVDILLGVEWEGCLGNKYGISGGKSAANAIADALIEAGIGDMKEAECRARAAELVAKTAAETGILKYEEMKHRAEVAERALEVACEKSNYCPNPSETIYNNDSECFETIDHCEYETEDCASCRNRYFLQQAEKELSKEGKDE